MGVAPSSGTGRGARMVALMTAADAELALVVSETLFALCNYNSMFRHVLLLLMSA